MSGRDGHDGFRGPHWRGGRGWVRGWRAIPAGVGLTLLAACAAGQGAQIAERARSELVGMPKDRLLSCAGVPDRQAAAGGREYYTYVSRSSTGYSPSSSIGIGGGSGGVGLGLGFGIPLGGGGGGCEATFVLGPAGTVEQISYPAGTSPGACAPIVENCVAPR